MKTVITLTKVFFKGHPKAGEETRFADLVKTGGKIHTCRDNADYWMKKIETLKATGGTLCIREWSDRPYRSPQNTIAEIPAERVHVSKLKLTRITQPGPSVGTFYHNYAAKVNGKSVRIEEIAEHDGFTSSRDFVAFLDPLFTKYQSTDIHLAIIHFNEFNY